MKEISEINLFNNISWGNTGHQLIAATAEKLLSENVFTVISKILKPIGNNHLKDIAIWADQIKYSNPKDPDSIQFIKDFPGRGKAWHFVDLPLGADAYDRNLYPEFTREDDIVQTINRCIDVLLDKNSSMSKLNALRWLTHLVGDIHQPLHVGCGYIDETGEKSRLNFDPKFILENNLSSDHGGNFIILSKELENELNLHSYWDGMLGFEEPADIALGNTGITKQEAEIVDLLVTTLKNNERPLTNQIHGADTTGRYAKDWATESLGKAREAYKTIEIESKLVNKKFRVSWEGKEKYEIRCEPIVKEQIQLAAQRLSIILNAIF